MKTITKFQKNGLRFITSKCVMSVAHLNNQHSALELICKSSYITDGADSFFWIRQNFISFIDFSCVGWFRPCVYVCFCQYFKLSQAFYLFFHRLFCHLLNFFEVIYPTYRPQSNRHLHIALNEWIFCCCCYLYIHLFYNSFFSHSVVVGIWRLASLISFPFQKWKKFIRWFEKKVENVVMMCSHRNMF